MLFTGAVKAEEDDPSFLNIGVSYFDVFGDDDATAFRAEYHDKTKFWIFKLFGGVEVTTDGSVFGFAGILTDYYFGRRIVVTPSVAPGYYHQGNGKDLGHEFEIKSGIELAYRFDDRSRVGVYFHHISNAGLEDTKPGVEALGISYSIPMR